PMIVRGVGYGAGEREFPDRPNVLRVLLGEDNPAWGKDEMLVMETNIDDMNPQFYDYLFERLFDAGARDVSLSPIQMKKNRPGILLRIITEPASRDKIAEIVLRETSTIGLRYYPVHRVVLKRALREIKTRFGPVKVKVIDGLGGESRTLPEYDDLKGIARSKKIPLKVVYEEVLNGLARKS
ncbi:MAG TPA: LarC family nickel insertion protein, partial [Candidatus Binatia bacterium]